jgi:hypothetical protein
MAAFCTRQWDVIPECGRLYRLGKRSSIALSTARTFL